MFVDIGIFLMQAEFYFYLAALGLSCGTQDLPSLCRAGSFVLCKDPSCGAPALEHAGSVVVMHRLSCSTRCRILFP